jgi:hypothetical protein
MKTLLVTSILYGLFTIASAQTIPYNPIPDWESSPAGHIATGLGLADINGDGWKDLVAANGNDIQRQSLVVYYNNGDGSFPQAPDWQSDDIDYHGHLACGDVDKDGDIDVAVSVYLGAGGFSSPGKVKVYYNEGNQLEANPSFISNPFYTFSCSLGDADGDGDLDIVTTAGEPYGNILDHGKLFLNNNGSFQTDPDWESDIEMGSLDVEFGDINRDGFMDVIFVCQDDDNYIYLGTQEGGISTSPEWISGETLSYINSVDIGYREPGESLVVMTENSQLGGQGKVRRYLFGDPIPAISSADWYSNPFGYGSGIILADVDIDSTLDLIYGGWWLPMKIALGDEGGFEIDPAYTSNTNSVIEAILMADLGKESIGTKTALYPIDEQMAGDHVIILHDQLIESVTGIIKNGNILSYTDYCYVPNKNWISFPQELAEGDTLEITYQQSPHPDIVITNWDSSKGNYIFYNTTPPVGMAEWIEENVDIQLFPNPASDYLNLRIRGEVNGEMHVSITDLSGRNILSTCFSQLKDPYRIDISALERGLYILRLHGKGYLFVKR